jgi:predicted HTH domain antitoxin
MNTLKVEIDIPYDLLTLAHVSSAEIGQKMKEWSVLHLFLEGSISAGKAAELLGVDKSTFLDLLSQWNLPYLDMSAEELSQELATSRATRHYQEV